MRIFTLSLILIALFATQAVATEIYLAKVTHVDIGKQQVQVKLLADDNSTPSPIVLEMQNHLLQKLHPGMLVRLWRDKNLDGFRVNKLMPVSPRASGNSRLMGVRNRMSRGKGGSGGSRSSGGGGRK